MRRNLKKPAVRHPEQIHDQRSRPNALTYRDDVEFLYDLKIGDAGAGYRRNRKMTLVSQLFPNSGGGFAEPAPFTKLYEVVQAPPLGELLDNCRHRLWSVRFYGCSLIRMGETGTESFKPIRHGTVCLDKGVNQVPTPIKGWIRTDDGIFRSFDILGDRTVEVYGTHITAGLLAPDNSYDLFTLASDGSEDVATDGIVDQSEVGVTISPIVVNSSQSPDEYTRCMTVPAGATGADSVVFPVPSGSRHAVISTPNPVADLAGLRASFSWIPPATTVYAGESPATDIEVTSAMVPEGQSGSLSIPGTPFMRFDNPGGDIISICVTFTKEA